MIVIGDLLKYSFKDRRDGDIEEIYSDVIKSKKILKWESKRSLDDMMSSSWKWQKNLVKFEVSLSRLTRLLYHVLYC